MAIEPLQEKWEAFGWRALSIDGHDFTQICEAIETARAETKKPVIIIANTVKGKGIDYMENQAKWHYAGIDSDMMEKAIESIRRKK